MYIGQTINVPIAFDLVELLSLSLLYQLIGLKTINLILEVNKNGRELQLETFAVE